MQLQMNVRSADGIQLVECKGRLMFGEESASFRDILRALLTETKQVVLTMDQIEYMDSGGLGTLVALCQTAHAQGAVVKLAALPAPIKDMLRVTNLLAFFDVYDSEQAAVRSFAVQPSIPRVRTPK